MRLTCDILVAGGGVAGVPAAIAAARQGARVVLVEQEAFLGGAGVAALHRSICGLYLNGPDKPPETLNSGIVREIISRLEADAPDGQPLKMGRVWVFPYEPANFGSVYENLVSREPNIEILRTSSLQKIFSEGDRIVTVHVRTPEGLAEIEPGAVIDATGAGVAIRLSGAAYSLAPESERQVNGCTVHVGGIAGDRQLLGIKIPWALSRLSPGERRNVPVFAGFAAGSGDDDGYCKWSVEHTWSHPGGTMLSECINRGHSLLAEHLPEFSKSRIIKCSRSMEREGIRIAGVLEIDENTVLQGRKFPDGLVRNSWPVEYWGPSHALPRYAYPPDGDYYEIPRRCLCSRTIANLLATGRCISASSQALASTRVMGTCIALGESAGNIAVSLTTGQGR